MIKVFISYSWDSDEHREEVFALTNHLINEGIDAKIDELLKQEETAIDFYQMMHEAITGSDKIIIVLSEGYKTKATDFTNGVGNEYSMIIKEIKSKPRKYILVSFEGIKAEIAPLQLLGREIIDLSLNTRNKSIKKLLLKIHDKHERVFDKPVEKKLDFEAKPIRPFIGRHTVTNTNKSYEIEVKKKNNEEPYFDKKIKKKDVPYLFIVTVISALALILMYLIFYTKGN